MRESPPGTKESKSLDLLHPPHARLHHVLSAPALRKEHLKAPQLERRRPIRDLTCCDYLNYNEYVVSESTFQGCRHEGEKDRGARSEGTIEQVASRCPTRAGMGHHRTGKSYCQARADFRTEPIISGAYPSAGRFRAGGAIASRRAESSPSSSSQGRSGTEMVTGGPWLVSTEVTGAVYWDSSAILSTLFRDRHSDEASRRADGSGVHFLSTLAWAEVQAVIARVRRERALVRVLVDAAREVLEGGPWRRLNVSPDWKVVRDLSIKWPLRGADLWHLAVAKSLQTELPELILLSFDARLAAAAEGEGLA